MDERLLTVTFSGPTGCGKGTANEICRKALTEHGFSVNKSFTGDIIFAVYHGIPILPGAQPKTTATFHSLMLWAVWILLRHVKGFHPTKADIESWREHALRTNEVNRLDPLP